MEDGPKGDSGPGRRVVPGWVIVLIAAALVVAPLTQRATAASIATAIKTWVVRPFVVTSDSNAPAVVRGDRVLVMSKRPFSRGDLVVLEDPTGKHPALVARVVAVGGDTVDIRDGELLINGTVVREPYVGGQQTLPGATPMPVHLASDMVFVLGDNRSVAGDSRYYGPVAGRNVIGPIGAIYWPPAHARDL